MEKLSEAERNILNQLTNRKSERIVKMNCIDCGEEFETTVGRICSTYNNGLIVPCRCSKCKKAKDDKFKSYEEVEKLI